MRILLIAMALALMGCATANRLNRISIGMSKAQVLDVMGYPDSTGAVNKQEDMIYTLKTGASWSTEREFFVRLVDGKVVSYGKKGDYDSARMPATNINIHKHED